jgi:hypothetical protein
MGKSITIASTDRQTEILREKARAGQIARYIVRCGLEASGKVAVWDALGGWLCSRHKTLALAEKRAAELNAEAA